ncbi:MAG: hypothetical protein OSA97_06770 [Nevskia sp.]|nr:hypothetical protein [Nevskia sp.]
MSLVVLRGETSQATVSVSGWGKVLVTLANGNGGAYAVLAMMSSGEADKFADALKGAVKQLGERGEDAE